MIDGLVAQCGERLSELWKRDEGGTGQYPPPSLHVIITIILHSIYIHIIIDYLPKLTNAGPVSIYISVNDL